MAGDLNTLPPNAAQVAAFLKGKGLDDVHIAGILGNLQQENNFGTETNSGGLGMAQWLGTRATALQAYASQNGWNPNSVVAQENFLYEELTDPKFGSYQGDKTKNDFFAAKTPAAAALAFSNDFERPLASAANNVGREQYADAFYPSLAGVAAGFAPGGAFGSTAASTGAGTPQQALVNAVPGLSDIAAVFDWLTNAQNLLRVGYFVVGAALVLVGGAKLIGTSVPGPIGKMI